ncbi:DYH1B, partial [Symbiodinium sp. KB8]
DINLPQPDKYNTCPLIAFLQQLVTFNGFYDENLEFLGLERVHIVSTMNPSTTVGRHNLSTRFTAIVRLGYMEYPDTTELSYIYRAYAQGALGSVTTLDARARSGEFMQRIADTMVSVYEQIKAKFTVDDHRHYLFTPRDLTSWVQGLLRYRLESADALVEVLAHEAQRIFGDRLVGPDAHTSFDGILNSVLRSRWGFKGNSANSDYYVALAHGGGSSGAAGGGAGGGARAGGSGGEDQGLEDGKQAALLERVKEDELRALVERGLMMYEREEKELHIQLFREVLDHIAQVDRVLSEEGGSLLLVGHSGVGRRSATTLVAHMHGMELYTPAITRSYGAKQFFGDIKGVLQKAGVAGEEVVLYIEDHQFTEVPGLYSHEELESILSPLKELMSESGVGFRTPYEFFVSRIRANLHVVLGMDPHHPEFLVRCESNPALYTRCTILWMGEWRTASMKALPAMLIPDLLERTRDPEEFVSQLVAVHQSAKRVAMATPRDFISFLKTYRFLYEQKVGGLEKETSHLAKGLGKLREAERVVDELSTQAAKQQEELQQSQRAVEEALEDVSNAMVMATERKKTVKELQSTLAVKEAEIQKEKDSIEEELSGIRPILEEAKKA